MVNMKMVMTGDRLIFRYHPTDYGPLNALIGKKVTVGDVLDGGIIIKELHIPFIIFDPDCFDYPPSPFRKKEASNG